MHLLIHKASLLKALFHQHSLVERRGPSPILSHIKLETRGDNQVVITGTDLESTLREDVEAEIIQGGSITVSAHMLYDVVRKMPDGLITLNHGENPGSFHNENSQKIKENLPPFGSEEVVGNALGAPLKISGPDIDFSLPTLPSSEFPVIQSSGTYEKLILPVKVLSYLIGHTRFAMSSEETRYALNGIYFHGHENHWRAVATDARLLALSWISLEDYPELKKLHGFIVGRKAIGEINKLLENQEGDVALDISKNHLICTLGSCSFSSRLIDGQFPDYTVAVPQNNPHSISLPVKPLEEAITRVSMVSFDKQRLVRFSLSNNTLVLSACSPQYGSAVEKINLSCDNISINLGFNPKHLLDICNHIAGETLVMDIKNNSSPVLFRDPKEENLRFILMPLRIS